MIKGEIQNPGTYELEEITLLKITISFYCKYCNEE